MVHSVVITKKASSHDQGKFLGLEFRIINCHVDECRVRIFQTRCNYILFACDSIRPKSFMNTPLGAIGDSERKHWQNGYERQVSNTILWIYIYIF